MYETALKQQPKQTNKGKQVPIGKRIFTKFILSIRGSTLKGIFFRAGVIWRVQIGLHRLLCLLLTAEIGMNEFHSVAGSHLYRGIVLRKDEAAVVLDDQVSVHFLKKIDEIGQRRGRRHGFGQPVHCNSNEIAHRALSSFNLFGHHRPGNGGCG
jgi:hypothetical protein